VNAVRGKRKARRKHLEKAGWVVVEESKGHHKRHCLVLHHLHGKRNLQHPEDARAEEVRIEAPTRPRAYLEAERTLIAKSGRRVRPILPSAQRAAVAVAPGPTTLRGALGARPRSMTQVSGGA
jgi:hypothetical protein